MKISLTAFSRGLNAPVDLRFRRRRYVISLDSKKMEHKIVENVSTTTSLESGTQATQALVKRGMEAAVTGNTEPNANNFPSSANVKVFIGTHGSAQDVLEKHNEADNGAVSRPAVVGHFGIAPHFTVINLDEDGHASDQKITANTSGHIGSVWSAPDRILQPRPNALITFVMVTRGLNIFQNARVDVLRSNVTTLREVIAVHNHDELEELTEDCH